MYDTSNIARLIKKKLDGTISPEELVFLEKWGLSSSSNAALLKKVENEKLLFQDVIKWLELEKIEGQQDWIERLEERTISKIQTTVENESSNKLQRIASHRYLPYVASLLFFLAVFVAFYTYHNFSKTELLADLEPGGNRASITLSDGRVIELSEQQDAVVLGEELTYADGSVISDLNDSHIVYAELRTPRGGQYNITLSDGTKVWLNADSKLKYPTRFEGDVREVELDGEAYFDVTRSTGDNKKQRFVVKTVRQQVEVLGTAFNVQAYTNDAVERTTLVEGAVALSGETGSVMLTPGDQGLVSVNGLNTRKVDVEQYLAWKNNEFIFHETTLNDALIVLSRWYDFEIVYEGKIPVTHLYGSIDRDKGLAEVLKIMEASGLKFRIERTENLNKLIVLK